jgi:hypothetical protein
MFYEQPQRGSNLSIQVWCLVYLSAGFNLSFLLMSGTCTALPVTSAGFTRDYSYFRCLPPMYLHWWPHPTHPWQDEEYYPLVPYFWHPPPLCKDMHISRLYLSAIHRITFISMNFLYVQNKPNHKKKTSHFIVGTHMSIHTYMPNISSKAAILRSV